MSILFNKLKLLKKDKSPFENESEKLVKNRNVYNFRRFVFSPVGSILILAFLVFFGLLSFYSLFMLQGYLSKKSITPTGSNIAGKQLGNIPAKQDSQVEVATKDLDENPSDEILDIPKAPENITAGKSQTGKLMLSSSSITPNTIKEVDQIAYLEPPQTLSSNAALYQLNPSPDSGIMTDADSPPFDTGNPDYKSVQLNKGNSYKTINKSKIALAVNETEIVNSDHDLSIEKIVSNKGKPIVKTASPEEIRFQRVRKLKTQRMHYVSKIAFLTRQIEDSLRKNDFEKADKLINSFALTNNSNTAYFLKLKAFIDIKKGRLEAASSLLYQVLEANPYDLEAGINMAVVQIKRNNIVPAKKRLLRLKENHPSNSRINALLNQL